MNQLELIQSKIYEIRGQRVMLDFDLAELYQVETRVLNQAVKRNIDRFPEDFMFQVTAEEPSMALLCFQAYYVVILPYKPAYLSHVHLSLCGR